MRHTQFQGITLQGFFVLVMQPTLPQAFMSEFGVREADLGLSVTAILPCLYISLSLGPHKQPTQRKYKVKTSTSKIVLG